MEGGLHAARKGSYKKWGQSLIPRQQRSSHAVLGEPASMTLTAA